MKIAVWLTFALLLATILIQSVTVAVVMRRNGDLRKQQEACLTGYAHSLNKGRAPSAHEK